MLTVVVWKWCQPGFRVGYAPEYVGAMRDMVAKHYPEYHRFVCVTDDPENVPCETFPLWEDCNEMRNACGQHLPSCYRRLKLFSSKTTDAMGIARGSRVVSMDLDMVVTNSLLPIFNRPERFVGWRVPGTRHPFVYNGSMWMFRAGQFDWLWDEFDVAKSPTRAQEAGFFGSDQAWISYRLQQGEGGWDGRGDGFYSYTRDVMRSRFLPNNTRLVSFNGKRKPWHAEVHMHSSWVRKHYPIQVQTPSAPAPVQPPAPRRSMRHPMQSGTSVRGI